MHVYKTYHFVEYSIVFERFIMSDPLRWWRADGGDEQIRLTLRVISYILRPIDIE